MASVAYEFFSLFRTKIPNFTDEDEEREFWTGHFPPDCFNSKKSRMGCFPNLKPSLKSISIRLLLEDLLVELKTLANKGDVPYQSLAKIFLARQIVLERESSSNSSRRRKERVADLKNLSQLVTDSEIEELSRLVTEIPWDK